MGPHGIWITFLCTLHLHCVCTKIDISHIFTNFFFCAINKRITCAYKNYTNSRNTWSKYCINKDVCGKYMFAKSYTTQIRKRKQLKRITQILFMFYVFLLILHLDIWKEEYFTYLCIQTINMLTFQEFKKSNILTF